MSEFGNRFRNRQVFRYPYAEGIQVYKTIFEIKLDTSYTMGAVLRISPNINVPDISKSPANQGKKPFSWKSNRDF